MHQNGGGSLTVVVRLAAGLRLYADGSTRLEVEVPPSSSLRDVVEAVADVNPAIGRRLRDETGALRPHVNLFVGPDNARDLDGLDTAVPDGADVWALAAVSGG